MRCAWFVLFSLVCALAHAHDTWVQTNTNLIRVGDAVHIDLMLGNHGNEHRDFKLAGKLARDSTLLRVHAPSGQVYDITEQLIDTGYSEKEGFWTAKFSATTPGLYVVEHNRDNIVNHGQPLRSIRSAKTLFVVSRSLDNVPRELPGFNRVLGHALELVPEANPVVPMGPGTPIRVQVLFQGKPLPNAVVSFIPRGKTLAAGIDSDHERRTNDHGQAAFTPSTGNYHLVVVHHFTDERGANYVGTKYTATLTVFVPEMCPCCGE